jgi:hypothetical protein
MTLKVCENVEKHREMLGNLSRKMLKTRDMKQKSRNADLSKERKICSNIAMSRFSRSRRPFVYFAHLLHFQY